jgi:stage V sporulation protein B
MAAAVHWTYSYVETIAGGNKATLVSVLIGVVVYAIVLLAIGAVRKRDFELLPGGSKISRILTKLNLIRD